MTNQHSSSRRSLLAALWSIVGLLTLTSFVIAILFAYASKKYDEANNNDDNNYNTGDYNGNYNNNQNYNDAQQSWSQQQGSGISVTSRAMVFAAIWTAVLSGILVIYGTVILGVRMPITGKYYACCAGNVHRMTPLSLGAFGGSLLMFANLTLVCAILFGEFEIRDFNFGASQQKEEQNNANNDDDDDASDDSVVDQSSFAFSIMCVFFTVMYAAFAALVFYNSNALLEESVADARDELSSSGPGGSHHTAVNNAPGYFGGDRFGVSRSYATNKGTKNIEVM
mmetsp:Transcript_26209/g.47555  ORF Transcript_26209/g.47555 Transcript_26209/m.47555 type:complete len:282 (-) Transcript_26209:1334-2179(-)